MKSKTLQENAEALAKAHHDSDSDPDTIGKLRPSRPVRAQTPTRTAPRRCRYNSTNYWLFAEL